MTTTPRASESTRDQHTAVLDIDPRVTGQTFNPRQASLESPQTDIHVAAFNTHVSMSMTESQSDTDG